MDLKEAYREILVNYSQNMRIVKMINFEIQDSARQSLNYLKSKIGNFH